jgi:TrmH family RNA methyltransferase
MTAEPRSPLEQKMALITSKSNPLVKEVRKLHARKERDESRLAYVEGLRPVLSAIEAGAPIVKLIVAPALLSSSKVNDVLEREQDLRERLVQVSEEVFRSFALREGPQGVAALVKQGWVPLETIAPRQNDLWLALDRVQDPGNLGTCLRTLDAAGGQGLILIGPGADPYDGTAIRAAMGATFGLKLCRASAGQFLSWKKALALRLVGTSDSASIDYRLADYGGPLVLLMGSEREGLSAELLAACDELVRIPMSGREDSLNLAVATGVMLYRIYDRRSGGTGGDREP